MPQGEIRPGVTVSFSRDGTDIWRNPVPAKLGSDYIGTLCDALDVAERDEIVALLNKGLAFDAMKADGNRLLDAFSNQLRLVRSIDMHEIDHPEIAEWWPAFRDDPFMRFLSLDDSRQRAIWEAMLKRGA